jgi:hypothetical protein
MALVDTIKSWFTRDTIKAYSSGYYAGLGYLYGGGVGRNRDLLNDKWGAAAASVTLSAPYRGTTLRADAVNRVPWRIVDVESGDEIASSTDIAPKHPLAKAIIDSRKHDDAGLLYLWEMSRTVVGENFIWRKSKKVNFDYHPHALLWLNPLNVVKNTPDGKHVTEYQYNSGNESITLLPHQVSYDRIVTLVSDIDGWSPVRSAMAEINVDRNAFRAWGALFRNGALTGDHIMPDTSGEELNGWTEETLKDLGAFFQNNIKGVDNQGKSIVWPGMVNVIPGREVDFSKQLPLPEAMERSIFRTMGISEAVAGDTSNLRYKAGAEIFSNFQTGVIASECIAIQEEINASLIPFFLSHPRLDGFGDGQFRFEFDLDFLDATTEEKSVKRQATIELLNSGLMTYNEAREEVGLPIVDGGDKLFIPTGVTVVDSLADAAVIPTDAPGFELVEQSPVLPDDAGDTGGESVIENVADTSLKLADQPPENIESAAGLNGAQIASAVTVLTDAINGVIPFEVTRELLIALGIDPQQVERMIIASKNHELPAVIEDVKALIIESDTPDLDAIKAQVDERVAAVVADIKAYGKFIENNTHKKRPFYPGASRGVYADAITEHLEANGTDGIKAVIEAQVTAAQVKAIGDTRSVFDTRFNELLEKARSGELTRRQWSNQFRRNLLPITITQAFTDGLRDGGVEVGLGDLDDEDIDTIEDIIAQQSKFVTKFGETLFKEGITDAQAAQKSTMWFNKSVMPAYSAGLVSAKANQMMEFVGTDGKDSCDTCQRLKGQRHRAIAWKRAGLWPQVDTERFDHGLGPCKHELKPVSGSARGNWLRDAPGKFG